MPEQTTLPAKKTNGTLFKWDPLEMFDTFQEEMDRFWHRPWPGMPALFGRPVGQGTASAPRMDVYEKDNALYIKVELPGLKKEDVQVEYDNGTLIIRGQAKAEAEVKETAYYRLERTYGTYFRRMALPFEVTPDQIQATLTDGVLEIKIPKPTETKSEATKIAIS
jgi:HSP20 family protein